MDLRLTCDHCGRRLKVSGTPRSGAILCPSCRKPLRGVGDNEEDAAAGEDRPAGTKPSGAASRPRRRRRRRGSDGRLAGLFGALVANLPFLLTRVLPVVAVVVGMAATLVHIERKRRVNRALEQLANKLWSEAGGASAGASTRPYVRGQLAVLETQSSVKPEHQDLDKPQHWINTSILPPPLDDPGSIGSVILVEWQVLEDVARNAAGMPMTVTSGGRSSQGGDPVMLKRWDCRVKLIDLRRKKVVYESRLSAPNRTFGSGNLALVTPSTVVTDGQFAAELDKIRAFPLIPLDGDPPAPAPAGPENAGEARED